MGPVYRDHARVFAEVDLDVADPTRPGYNLPMARFRIVVAVVLISVCVLAVESLASEAPSVESLLPRIDRAIARVRERSLRSDRDTPWVVTHALLAFGQDLRIHDVDADEQVNAVDYLLTRARHDGKRIFRDDDGEPALPTRNISHGLDESFLVQDHVDQFLMVFAEAGVALDRRIVAEGGHTFTVADMLAASRRGFRSRQELAWTLVVMSIYTRPGETWANREGKKTGIEDLLALAIERDPRTETEGGPHHLYGVASALREHRRRGGKIEGVWAGADRYLRRYASLTEAWQQKDGALSGGVFHRNSEPRTPRHLVSTTGHALEWMSVALPVKELKADWVRRAVARLCSELEQHPANVFSDGGLYHAAHALRLYREAVGPAS